MSIEIPGAGASDIGLCRYAGSKLACRGPMRPLDGPYVAFIGGTETFGRFVTVPFAEQVERVTGRTCVNLGAAHSGVDAWLTDPALTGVAAGAETVLIQLPGAQTLSNRYYRVHPRRNDRFLAPEPPLAELFPEVDFTDFTFVNHMLSALNAVSVERFSLVRNAVQELWSERMPDLIRRFRTPPILLWLRYDSVALNRGCAALGSNPVFVEGTMVDRLRPIAGPVVALDLTTASVAHELKKMRFGPMQAPAAAQMPGPSAHKAVAKALLEIIEPAE